jgi:hypothetical protein
MIQQLVVLPKTTFGNPCFASIGKKSLIGFDSVAPDFHAIHEPFVDRCGLMSTFQSDPFRCQKSFVAAKPNNAPQKSNDDVLCL